MSIAIRSSFVDHTGLDGTGDAINGNEVDENPNVVADILDGTLATDLAGAGTLDFVMTDTRAGIRLIDLSNAAAAIHEGLVLEWDPGDGGNLTDNSSGIGIDFKLPDDADAQTVFGSLNVVCVDDAAASTDGEFSFRVTAAGTDNVEQMTLSAAAMVVTPPATITGLITATAGITSGSNIVSDTDSTDDLGTSSVRWANLFVDSIGDTGQALALTSGANNTTLTAAIFALTGAQTVSSTLGVTGLTTATGGITSGANIVSDTDSTDDLGTTSVRWANVYTDAVGDSGAPTALNASSMRAANIPSILVKPVDSGLANVTGDGTVYTIVYGSEVFDQGADFSSTTFTAPVTGRYQVSGQVMLSNMASGHTTASINVVTSNRSYLQQFNPYAISSGTLAPMPFSAIVDMDAADTITVTAAVSGGAKTVYVNQNTDTDVRTWLSVQMIA